MLLRHRGCEHPHKPHELAQPDQTESPQAPTPTAHLQNSEVVAGSAVVRCSHMVGSPSGAGGHDDALERETPLGALEVEWEMDLGCCCAECENLSR